MTVRGRVLVLTVLVAMLAAGALPASAAHDSSTTASVDVREVPAGASGPEFKLRVDHPPAGLLGSPPVGSTPPINFVRVQAPAGLVLPTSASGPPGWQVVRHSSDGVDFIGGRLEPGQSGQFVVIGDVARPAADACGEWRVRVSSDGGQTIKRVNPAVPGGLRTCVRVLEVERLDLLAPEGARDATVTAGQTEVCARVRLGNHGTARLVVTPLLDGIGATAGPALAGADPPCSGEELVEGGAAIGPAESADVDFVLAFGGEGTGEVSAAAGAPGATVPDAMVKTLSVLIQPRPAFSYVAASLEPTAVHPGAGVAFALEVRQGEPAVPAVDLAPGSSFGFDGFSVAMGVTTVLAGSGTFALRFPPALVPAGPEESFPGVVLVHGTDANGAALSADLPTDPVSIGRVIKVRGTLSGPPPACCVPPEEPAVRGEGGATTTLSNVRMDRSNPDSGRDEPCADCRLEQVVLQQFADGECGTPLGKDISISSGPGPMTYNGAYDPKALAVRALLVAEDSSGRRGDGLTNCLDVDSIVPHVVSATVEVDPATGRRTVVRIRFNECVGGGGGPGDWQVDSNVVVSESADPGPGNYCRTRTLHTLMEFPEDPPYPCVRYRRQLATSSPYYDRVGHVMTDQTVCPSDLVSPAAPVIAAVDGRGPQDGKFYFNREQVSVVLTGAAVRPGYKLEVWEEANGAAGLQRSGEGGDRRLASAVAQQGDSITLPADFTGPDRESPVYAVAFDVASPPNMSKSGVATFVLDRVAPAFLDAVVSESAVTVYLTEPVPRGRNYARDWGLREEDGGFCSPSAVSVGLTQDSRVLRFEEGCDLARAVEVSYVYEGPPSQRYEDRAGNPLADFKASI